MKLTTKVTVQKIRVIADYQRKDPNPMFVAILKAAYEHNFITINDAREKLSGPALNPRMWENILNRLYEQNYLEKRKILFTESSVRNEGFWKLFVINTFYEFNKYSSHSFTIEDIKRKFKNTDLNNQTWVNYFINLTELKYLEKSQDNNDQKNRKIRNKSRFKDEAIDEGEVVYRYKLTKIGRNYLYKLGNEVKIKENFYKKINNQLKEQAEYRYQLTDFGKEAAKRDTFFKSMKGELDIWIVKDKIDWLPFQIVKIEEVRSSLNKAKNSQRTDKFDLPKKRILDLKETSYRLKSVEDKCYFLGEEYIDLEINANQNNGEVTVSDLCFTKSEFSVGQLQRKLLSQKFRGDYQEKEQLVRISFDNDIQFERDVKIKKPTIGEVIFNPITLNDIHFMAKTIADAEKWRLTWMQANIKDYIFKDEDFEKLAYKIWNEFKPHYSISRLSISDYEKHLEQDKKENFYELMRLQAPKLLTF